MFRNEQNRYPERTKEEIENACPFCHGNCNCRTCLQADVVVKVCCSNAFILIFFLYLESLRKCSLHKVKKYSSCNRLGATKKMRTSDCKGHFICYTKLCPFSGMSKRSRILS